MTGALSWFSELNSTPSWADLLEGLKRGIIDASDAINFAAKYWSNHPGSNAAALYDLVSAGPADTEEVRQALEGLSGNALTETALAVRRWRYLVLRHAIDATHDRLQIMQEIERVYADFGYPPEMEGLIYYMHPTDGYDPSVHTLEENQERILRLAMEFLDSEGQQLKQ